MTLAKSAGNQYVNSASHVCNLKEHTSGIAVVPSRPLTCGVCIVPCTPAGGRLNSLSQSHHVQNRSMCSTLTAQHAQPPSDGVMPTEVHAIICDVMFEVLHVVRNAFARNALQQGTCPAGNAGYHVTNVRQLDPFLDLENHISGPACNS
jgi:hypothetical protein